MEFVLITDCHFKRASNVRNDEDYLKTLLDKLDFVISCANKWNARLVMAGDFFDTPSQPDLVKTAVIKSLNKCEKQPWTIMGNHDILFNNTENNYKTSCQVLHEAGVWKVVLSNEDFDYTEDGQKIRVAVTRPMKEVGYPQLGLFHGFLNKDDGRNTFLFEDINTNDNCVICLGHDHVPYDPVIYKNSTIYRIGAMVRAIRNDSEQRTPQLLRIKLKKDNTWVTKLYDIPCKDPSLIFKTKKVKADKIENDYQAIISQIKQISSKELSLIDAISMVTDTETTEYVRDALNTVHNTLNSK